MMMIPVSQYKRSSEFLPINTTGARIINKYGHHRPISVEASSAGLQPYPDEIFGGYRWSHRTPMRYIVMKQDGSNGRYCFIMDQDDEREGGFSIHREYFVDSNTTMTFKIDWNISPNGNWGVYWRDHWVNILDLSSNGLSTGSIEVNEIVKNEINTLAPDIVSFVEDNGFTFDGLPELDTYECYRVTDSGTAKLRLGIRYEKYYADIGSTIAMEEPVWALLDAYGSVSVSHYGASNFTDLDEIHSIILANYADIDTLDSVSMGKVVVSLYEDNNMAMLHQTIVMNNVNGTNNKIFRYMTVDLETPNTVIWKTAYAFEPQNESYYFGDETKRYLRAARNIETDPFSISLPETPLGYPEGRRVSSRIRIDNDRCIVSHYDEYGPYQWAFLLTKDPDDSNLIENSDQFVDEFFHSGIPIFNKATGEYEFFVFDIPEIRISHPSLMMIYPTRIQNQFFIKMHFYISGKIEAGQHIRVPEWYSAWFEFDTTNKIIRRMTTNSVHYIDF